MRKTIEVLRDQILRLLEERDEADARARELEAALEKIERTPLRGSAGMANVRDIARRALAASPEERGGWHGSAAGGAEGDTP